MKANSWPNVRVLLLQLFQLNVSEDREQMDADRESSNRASSCTACGGLFTLFIDEAQQTKLSSLDATGLCDCMTKKIRQDLPRQQSSAALFTQTRCIATGQ